ncbi:hypothetical protein ACE1CI_35620 [Aerosakkonemataceae cyanobacterium BLCC-F50]|uniref:Uncharacterized protein n=1 Tax=Floridaenema flaviceps BLCC-F50 TaxID=3153642 RepID=A0ABV4Y4P7_9CYAN
MQRITKQSTVSAQLAKEQNSVDVGSLLKVEDAIAAQAELHQGAVTIHTAVAFLVYCDSHSKLDDDCRHIQSLFLRPAWVLRETEYPWKLWLQTLPIC